jgi:hypothetical protein
MEIVKSIATSLAALAAVGGVAAGISASATLLPQISPAQVQLTAIGVPVAQDPPPVPTPPPSQDVPTPDQLTNILTSFTDPDASYVTKAGLVEGGINPLAFNLFGNDLRNAGRRGELPLSFEVSNIQPTGTGAASADVAISDSRLPAPNTHELTFVNQGRWMLSHASATYLLVAATRRWNSSVLLPQSVS